MGSVSETEQAHSISAHLKTIKMVKTNLNFDMINSQQNLPGSPRKIKSDLPLKGKEVFYKKNTVIINEGDRSSCVHIIRSGKVRIFLKGGRGKIMVLGELKAGEYFGEMSLIDKNGSSTSAMAVEDTEVMEISQNNFRKYMRSNPDVAERIMLSLVTDLRKAHAKISNLAFVDVYGRVANMLLALAEDQNSLLVVNEKPSQQHMANVVGASREMISRILKKMVVAGDIRMVGKQIVIKRQPGNSA